MFKAGISNREKNLIRGMWRDGKTVEQVSVLLRVRPEHVRAVYDRLNTEGIVKYTTGNSKEARAPITTAGEVQPGEPGQTTDVSPRDAELQVNSALEAENIAMREELDALRKEKAAEAAEAAESEETAAGQTEGGGEEDAPDEAQEAAETPVQRRRRRKAAAG